MKLLIKDRGKGKTTQLIYTSEVTGYPIATFSHAGVEWIKEMAKEMGCDIPEPITYNDLKDSSKVRGTRAYENILADDINIILQEALNSYLHCNVAGAAMTNM